MLGLIQSRFRSGRLMHTCSSSRPSDALRGKIEELRKARRRRRDPRRDEFMVDVPESKSYLDTATMPMILTAVAVALFAKVLMTVDESKEQERIERRIRKAPPETGTVRMLTREEWDAIQEIRPRTPFESKFARPNARIRTDEPLRVEDVKDWTIDVLTDALSRVEDSVKHNPK